VQKLFVIFLLPSHHLRQSACSWLAARNYELLNAAWEKHIYTHTPPRTPAPAGTKGDGRNASSGRKTVIKVL